MLSEQALIGIVERSDWFMAALRAVRAQQLDSWCIGAGALRNLVWDTLHGHTTPTALADIDVAYFDAKDLSAEADENIQQALALLEPSMPWEVTNQAGVHLWFEAYFGHAVEPLDSLKNAVATWPEYATAVGVCLRADNSFKVIAPWGLDDLLGMRVRRNPTRVSEATFVQRMAQKQYQIKWPQITVDPFKTHS